MWSDGSAWSFTNWAQNEPSSNPNNEDRFLVVEIFPDWISYRWTENGKWNDVDANDRKYGMCQKGRGKSEKFRKNFNENINFYIY